MQKLHRRRKAAWLAHAGGLGRYKEDNEPSIIFKYTHGKAEEEEEMVSREWQ